MRPFSSKYKLKSKLAEGGMAQVYLASATLGGISRSVVLKQILPSYQKHSGWKEAFTQEAKVMMLLHHSNIVQVYDFGKDMLALEYIEGGTLLDVWQEAGPLPEEIVLYVGCEILKGLKHAHGKGVVHCDLSPSNILISRSGEVKISDFGISKLKAFGHPEGNSRFFAPSALRMTASKKEKVRFVPGKPAYMAPEVQAGEEHSPQSDIYALGKMLQEISNCPEAAYLQKAVSYNPSDRYLSAKDFEADLLRILKEKYPTRTYLHFEAFLKRLPSFCPRKTLVSHTAFDLKVAPKKYSWAWGMALLLLFLGGVGFKDQPSGTLNMNTQPWSHVYVNGVYYGETPMLNVNLPIGHHQIQFKNKNMGFEKTREITIHPNQTSKLIVTNE
ncbi:MAG: hypothetical protein A3B70_05605 [Deltaproteobacteria bacterium RIFCSPHIGHO2_02_FULL_40_11]|nr:MAG: hypothetical protein A3B70_05605 [Deltaproteobacteria bacterium RIFCSPHIGHO2_02_FULL_40_11]